MASAEHRALPQLPFRPISDAVIDLPRLFIDPEKYAGKVNPYISSLNRPEFRSVYETARTIRLVTAEEQIALGEKIAKVRDRLEEIWKAYKLPRKNVDLQKIRATVGEEVFGRVEAYYRIMNRTVNTLVTASLPLAGQAYARVPDEFKVDAQLRSSIAHFCLEGLWRAAYNYNPHHNGSKEPIQFNTYALASIPLFAQGKIKGNREFADLSPGEFNLLHMYFRAYHILKQEVGMVFTRDDVFLMTSLLIDYRNSKKTKPVARPTVELLLSVSESLRTATGKKAYRYRLILARRTQHLISILGRYQGISLSDVRSTQTRDDDGELTVEFETLGEQLIGDPDIELDALRNISTGVIHEIINRLPTWLQDIAHYRYEQGASIDQIAAIFGITSDEVKNRLAMIVRRVSSKLEYSQWYSIIREVYKQQ
ncbi:MAG: hypothetical protein WC775_00360 [Patescibacteria group bacterium]|jgi:DNA-directed RNA polymerase specialized sigma24 family protein